MDEIKHEDQSRLDLRREQHVEEDSSEDDDEFDEQLDQVEEEEVVNEAAARLLPVAGITVNSLSFRNISIAVQASRACKCPGSSGSGQSSVKALLRGATGEFAPGDMVAIMGTSGSGKTTLLNTLAGRAASNIQVTGTLELQGRPVSNRRLRKQSAYVCQEDMYLANSTIREALVFNGMMKGVITRSDEQERLVNLAVADMGLQHCVDSRIGGSGVSGVQELQQRGISGGERRRTSIACELLTQPNMIFLDEPTTGLDSTTAGQMMQLVSSLAKDQQRIVVCAIHAPSSQIFALFNKVMLLHEGRLYFYGRPSDALRRFRRHGHACPSDCNVADFLLKTIHDHHEDLPVFGLDDQQHQQQRVQEWSADVKRRPMVMDEDHDTRPAWWQQLYLLCQRGWTEQVRDYRSVLGRLAQNLFLSMVVGLLYLQLDKTQYGFIGRVGFLFFMMAIQALITTVHAVLTFAQERALYVREKSNKLYHTSAYFVARTLVDLPVQVLLPIIFGSVGYWMVGLRSDTASYGQFVGGMVMMSLACNSAGLVVGAAVPHAIIAVTLAPLSIIPFMLVCGFFTSLSSIRSYLRWLSALSPHKYIFSTLLRAELHDMPFTCLDNELFTVQQADGSQFSVCLISNGNMVLNQYEIDYGGGAFARDMWSMLGLFLGFRLLAYLALRFASNPIKGT